MVEAALAIVPHDGEPLLPDHDNSGIAGANGRLDNLDEVDTGLNGVDVHEDLLFAEVLAEPVVEAPSVRRAVLTSVADEDTEHGPPFLMTAQPSHDIRGSVAEAG